MILWKDRLRASGVHFGISLTIAAIAGVLVFGIWYPYPYREISGGRELFQLVIAVDVILGPLITLAIFDRTKGWKVLSRDLVVVALIQLAGLSYGLWTVFIARPVHMVFEYNRFRVVHAIDIPQEQLAARPAGVEAMPLLGPTPLSLRPFKDNREMVDATFADLAGAPLAVQSKLWQSYEAGRADVLKEAKPVDLLKKRFPAQAGAIDEAARTGARPGARIGWVPMIGRKTFWTTFVDMDTAAIVGYLPLDSF